MFPSFMCLQCSIDRAGYYCEAGSSGPVPCPSGYYSGSRYNEDISDCEICTAGIFHILELYIIRTVLYVKYISSRRAVKGGLEIETPYFSNSKPP